MGCQSSVILGNNLTFSVPCHDPDTAALTDADSVPIYRVYKDETSTPILTGTMTKLDDANTTGFYSELIICSTANDFEVGKSYNIYIEATVDGDTGGISYGFTVQSADVTLADDAITAAKIASGAIDDDALATDMDTYQAKVWLVDDGNAGSDRYTVVFFKNSQPVTSGITSPTLQVIKAADGTDLIASDSLTQIGATGLYRYNEATNRIDAGAMYIAKTQATIGGATRTWYQPVGRDST